VKRQEIVQSYLQAINLNNHDLNYGFLVKLISRHVATFAFSSVGSRLGEDLPLDLESLYQRIVVQRRGGYCFEQNGLLYEVLDVLGFSPKLYLARVIYDQNIHPGLTHRISVIKYDQKFYVLDVGFGSLGPRVPVEMSENETIDGDQVFRITEKQPGEFHMQVLKNGEFFSLYRFELARYGQADCELGHFYSHRHPDAAFVNHLVVSLIKESETRSLRDLDYWIVTNSNTHRQEVGDYLLLKNILIEELGVQVTEEEARRLYDELDT
jgi:N-hydroxyarylamine O-acetyltransferase